MKTYQAPWSNSLIIITALTTLVCVGAALGMIGSGRGIPPGVAVLPLAIIGGGGLFTIRGYTVTSNTLLVHRLFWTTRLPLAGLRSAQFAPRAMRWSLRTFGNGGLFSFTGHFWNKPLGAYRAFVTDPHRTVVLRFPTRTVVVSPAAPEEFVRALGFANEAA